MFAEMRNRVDWPSGNQIDDIISIGVGFHMMFELGCYCSLICLFVVAIISVLPN